MAIKFLEDKINRGLSGTAIMWKGDICFYLTVNIYYIEMLLTQRDGLHESDKNEWDLSVTTNTKKLTDRKEHK